MDEKGYMGKYFSWYHHNLLLINQWPKTTIRKNRILANPNLKRRPNPNQKQPHRQRRLRHPHLRVPHRPPLLKVIANRMLARQRAGLWRKVQAVRVLCRGSSRKSNVCLYISYMVHCHLLYYILWIEWRAVHIYTPIQCGTMPQTTAKNDKSLRMNAVLSVRVMTDFPTSLDVRIIPAFHLRAPVTLSYILLLPIHHI